MPTPITPIFNVICAPCLWMSKPARNADERSPHFGFFVWWIEAMP
jgi:hypothetical protein